jgi:transcriptional regulator with XRE-family HTH domain
MEEIVKTRKLLGLTQKDLALKLGVSKNTIYNWESGSTIPKSKIPILVNWIKSVSLDKIINIGNILNESEQDYLKNKNGNKFRELENGKFIMTVPLVPAKAYATYISECCEGYFFEEFNEVNFYVDQYARGNYVAFEIKGDSMDNSGLYDNPEGCITLCRELNRQHWTDGFRDSKYGWIIVHKDTIICKDIIGQDFEKGTILCHSRNTSPEFQDFNIEFNDVKQIFKVIKRTF